MMAMIYIYSSLMQCHEVIKRLISVIHVCVFFSLKQQRLNDGPKHIILATPG